MNQRVKILVDHYAGGSVKKFSEIIEIASSQKLNRVFNIDSRSGKYPEVSSDIILSVANKFSDVNLIWFLTGKGEMLQNNAEAPVDDQEVTRLRVLLDDREKTIETQTLKMGELNQEIGRLNERLAAFQTEGGEGDDTVGLVSTYGGGDRPTIDQTGVQGLPTRPDTSAEQLKRP